ncbi:MAG: PSD1 and planctomycete cytochrome C domain-containing protein [Planctomycetaceae bacterium]
MFRMSLMMVALLLTAGILRADDAATAKPDETPPTDAQLQFVRSKVLPLLEARCFECHAGSGEHKGALTLSSRRAMLKGGDSGTAIVPGKPDESLLIQAVRYEGFEMPPRTRMPAEEVRILEQWVRDGAVWPADLDHEAAPAETDFPLEVRKAEHWAWRPITDPQVPKVRHQDLVRDPIDAFVLAKLESEGIEPAGDTDRRTLIRRMSFDTIGLPPSVQQVEAFVNDPADDDTAIAKLADELLASPHFGERWGRHWLDLVRYAETLGHEFDYPLHNAWRYRDYVIRAFNADVPYDQFVMEHVAGDLLDQPRRHPTEGYNESILGTGFWFLHEDKHAPVDVRAEEAAKIDNQIDVFSKTFLGLTVACARCHDHKFDAISATDYYSLAGFLQSSRRQTAWLDPHQAIAQRVSALQEVRLRTEHVLAETRGQDDRTTELLRRELAGVLECLYGEPVSADMSADEDIVFADFEGDDFGDWQAKGEAFAGGPFEGTRPGQQAVSGYHGRRLVNSWVNTDSAKGTLRSPQFQIHKNLITLQVGGGGHSGQTCVNLLVDGKPVRTVTGRNQEQLRPHTWDVSDLHNRNAVIEIVDRHSGGWGHINVDHIVFTNSGAESGVRRSVSVVAAERGLNADRLRSWLNLLTSDAGRAMDSPVSLPAALAAVELSGDIQQAQRQVREVVDRWTKSIRQAADSDSGDPNRTPDTTLFADLSQGLPADWFTTGPAFDGARTDENTMLSWHDDGIQVAAAGSVHSARLSSELRGTLTSPTFELNAPEILVRVAGKDCRVRLVIDGYLMFEFSGLLFGGTKQDINTDDGEFQWLRMAGDIHRYQGHQAYLEFLDEGTGWFAVQAVRFANRPGAPAPANEPHPFNLELAATLTDSSNRELTRDSIIDAWAARIRTSAVPVPALNDLSSENSGLRQLQEQWRVQATGIPAPIPALAITEGTPEDEHVFIRGSHRNLGDTAPRAILAALRPAGAVPDLSHSSGRRYLAEQLVRDDNPLTARVAVNRIWHHLFGEGIVGSTDNFGVLGKRPTHPELLDHLASRFRHDNWSFKRLIRSLLVSRTYRLSSQRNDVADTKDPTDQWLHRARIRRLEGEAVRDALLTVSGRLDRTQFGEPVPVYLTSFMQGRGRPGGGPLDGNGRRSIYISVNRNFLSPLMLAFDVPAPVTTTGDRNTSNVPAQALMMLNNEFVNQQSQIWAKRLLNGPQKSAEETLKQAWYEAFSRPADSTELQALLEFLSPSADQSTPQLTPETLTEICHILLNSKEFLFLK